MKLCSNKKCCRQSSQGQILGHHDNLASTKTADDTLCKIEEFETRDIEDLKM